MLCPKCQALPPIFDIDNYRHHLFPDLQRSANEEGCALCRLLWAALGAEIQKKPLDSYSPHDYFTLRFNGARYPIHDTMYVDRWLQVWVSSDSEEPIARLAVYVDRRDVKQNLTPHLYLAEASTPAPSHQSEEVFDFFRRELQRCRDTHHNSCGEKGNTNVLLPTFVIDVRTAAEPFLVRNDGSQRGTYMALSYCWGGRQESRLTRSVLEAYRKAIVLTSLPQTLQDAVLVTRKLDVPYLWVDSMCIIQDDEAFKQQELERMSHIYLDAFATIQAAGCDAAHKGFLSRRQPPALPPVRLRFERRLSHDSAGAEEAVVSYATVSVHAHEDGGSLPTATRAWVFQESLLSPRLIYYGVSRAFFSCRMSGCCEDGITSNGLQACPFFYHNMWMTVQRANIEGNAQSAELLLRERALEFWYRYIPSLYSKRLCSDGDDRLVALAAFAQETHAAIGGRYLAGIWDADLVRGLQWLPEKETVLTRYAGYRAPSWSWAAHDGQVRYRPVPRLNTESRDNQNMLRQWRSGRLDFMSRTPFRYDSYGREILVFSDSDEDDSDSSSSGSWASYESGDSAAQLEYRYDNDEWAPTIVEAWTTYAAVSQFGACRGGKIVMVTRVGWLSLAAPRSDPDEDEPDERGAVLLQADETTVCFGWPDTAEAVPRRVCCAFLTPLSGLILLPAAGASEEERAFRRVGFFEVSNTYRTRRFRAWRASCEEERITLV